MPELIVICICLMLNAIFASVEMAFVTIPGHELKRKAKQGDKKAGKLLRLRENPERALSVIQIGITLVGAISAAVGGVGAGGTLTPYIEEAFGLNKRLAEVIAIGIVVVPLTYLSVVVGELVPKTIALRYPQAVLRFGSWVLLVGGRFLGPLVAVFEVSTRVILRIVLRKAGPSPVIDAPDVNFEEMEQHQRQYIINLANIQRRKIGDICLPWDEAVCIGHDETFGQILPKVIASGHTRLPVISEQGSVMGILHTKEFLSFVDSGNTDWQSIVRSAQRVRPEDDLLGVLRRLQGKKQHMAVVYQRDEPVGLVTVEDILEEIVGDISDEDDDGWIQKMLSQRSNALLGRR